MNEFERAEQIIRRSEALTRWTVRCLVVAVVITAINLFLVFR